MVNHRCAVFSPSMNQSACVLVLCNNWETHYIQHQNIIWRMGKLYKGFHMRMKTYAIRAWFKRIISSLDDCTVWTNYNNGEKKLDAKQTITDTFSHLLSFVSGQNYHYHLSLSLFMHPSSYYCVTMKGLCCRACLWASVTAYRGVHLMWWRHNGRCQGFCRPWLTLHSASMAGVSLKAYLQRGSEGAAWETGCETERERESTAVSRGFMCILDQGISNPKYTTVGPNSSFIDTYCICILLATWYPRHTHS